MCVCVRACYSSVFVSSSSSKSKIITFYALSHDHNRTSISIKMRSLYARCPNNSPANMVNVCMQSVGMQHYITWLMSSQNDLISWCKSTFFSSLFLALFPSSRHKRWIAYATINIKQCHMNRMTLCIMSERLNERTSRGKQASKWTRWTTSIIIIYSASM